MHPHWSYEIKVCNISNYNVTHYQFIYLEPNTITTQSWTFYKGVSESILFMKFNEN
jgi:hypothetical protein